MSSPITRAEHLAFITQGISDVESAIQNHPPETIAVFQRGMHALSQDSAPSKKLFEASIIPHGELMIALRYLAASAFISGWYQTRGEKAMRDEASSPACLFVATLGYSLDDVLQCYMEYERHWIHCIKEA